MKRLSSLALLTGLVLALAGGPAAADAERPRGQVWQFFGTTYCFGEVSADTACDLHLAKPTAHQADARSGPGSTGNADNLLTRLRQRLESLMDQVRDDGDGLHAQR